MAGALKQMRFIVSMKEPEQQLLKVSLQLLLNPFFQRVYVGAWRLTCILPGGRATRALSVSMKEPEHQLLKVLFRLPHGKRGLLPCIHRRCMYATCCLPDYLIRSTGWSP